jgi:hypothetical protein
MSKRGAMLTDLETRLDPRSIYLFAALASLLLSAWATYSNFIPNPDATNYLRAAEQFAAGQWTEGVKVFRWPFYSVAVAATMIVTGLSALAAAHLVNALLYVVIAVAFVALVGRLARGDRLVLAWAAVLVVLHPRLMEFRPFIIREHGMFAFLLLGLYFVVRDLQQPLLRNKLAIGLSILAAAMFRLEVLLFAGLIPAYYLLVWNRSRRTKLAVIGGTVLLCTLLLPGYLLWVGDHTTVWLSGRTQFNIGVLLEGRVGIVRERVQQLAARWLPDGEGHQRWTAYVSIILGMTLFTMARVATPPLLFLSTVAFVPRRLLPADATRFVVWFAGWQIPLLFVFAFFSLFLTTRHVMVFVLLITIPAIFTAAFVTRAWLAGAPGSRGPFALTVVLIGVLAAWYFPRPGKLDYLREAGQWVSTNIPADARVVTNDPRIAYFSKRQFDRQIVVDMDRPSHATYLGYEADYAVVEVRGGSRNSIGEWPGFELVGTVASRGNAAVLAYRMQRKK